MPLFASRSLWRTLARIAARVSGWKSRRHRRLSEDRCDWRRLAGVAEIGGQQTARTVTVGIPRIAFSSRKSGTRGVTPECYGISQTPLRASTRRVGILVYAILRQPGPRCSFRCVVEKSTEAFWKSAAASVTGHMRRPACRRVCKYNGLP